MFLFFSVHFIDKDDLLYYDCVIKMRNFNDKEVSVQIYNWGVKRIKYCVQNKIERFVIPTYHYFYCRKKLIKI